MSDRWCNGVTWVPIFARLFNGRHHKLQLPSIFFPGNLASSIHRSILDESEYTLGNYLHGNTASIWYALKNNGYQVTACIDECEEVLKATIPLSTPETLLSPSQSSSDDAFESSSNVWSEIASSCASSNGSNEISTASPPLTRVPYLGSICHSHMVLFYYDEEYLYNSITRYGPDHKIYCYAWSRMFDVLSQFRSTMLG